ncbi:MAG: prolyl oligopeptidase family serine peptidase [Candidatus Eisenbacteria bacterium]
MRRFLLGFALAALATSPAWADGPATPYMVADSTVTADETFSWLVQYTIRNPLAVGFYADSFYVDLEDRGANGSRASRRRTDDLHALLATIRPISGGDELSLQFTMPAAFEEGTLGFRLYGHSPEGTLPPLTATVIARPGVMSAAFPSRLVNAGAERVELVPVPLADATRPAAGVLLVQSEDGHARELLRYATLLRQRGIASVIVSLPGCGGSNGPADFAGPATLRALDAGWNELLRLPGVDKTRLAAVGISEGGTAVARWAGRRNDVRAVALLSAYYDLASSARANAGGELANRIATQAGRDSSALRARSPLVDARRWKMPVLVLHGANDTDAPVADARDFAARAQAAGADVQLKVLDRRAHALGAAALPTSLTPFLVNKLAPGAPTRRP